MKPQIENVLNHNDFNWLVREYHCAVKKEEFLCSWHYHAEYELVLYRDPNQLFDGRYFAGDSVGQIEHNTMVLYGPGVPHMITGKMANAAPVCDDPIQQDSRHHTNSHHHSLILWFRHPWIESLQSVMPELKVLNTVLQRSAHGLIFRPETAERVFPLLEKIEQDPPHQQLLRVLQALMMLATEEQYAQTLSLHPYGFQLVSDDDETNKRVEQARKYIERHYAEPIKMRDLCRALHMSESSAYRLFERHFMESFSDHVKRFRIGKSCELLVSSQLPVGLVAERSGFNNLSNFNRQFKQVKGVTPSEFRTQFK
ncbi:transcriptional regulator AraC family [Photobacterium aphoticum]|uniref:Transcriptional regulator AraC family n=1 Tax=Photobacterium aphoticum TaxID=754436 RepID=A0A090QMJ4_9GAMM|nr:transcriptional regulator AraC family [Photobacterium aphoticum]